MTRSAGTYAIFETSQGNIVIKLFDKEAPKTVETTKKPEREKSARSTMA